MKNDLGEINQKWFLILEAKLCTYQLWGILLDHTFIHSFIGPLCLLCAYSADAVAVIYVTVLELTVSCKVQGDRQL